MKILIAEDNDISRKMIEKMVQSLGHEFESVANGFDAVNAVANSGFDIVLMDVQMPIVDGLEATRRIRSSASTPGTPKIIAITANSMLSEKEACLEAGVDKYLAKPITVEDLTRVLVGE